MFLFPLLYRGIICIALVLRYRVLFLCPENKTQVEKTEKEAFDVSGMKLYCYENLNPYRGIFSQKSTRNTTLKERIERVPPMTKKRKEEWSFFLNERNRITYHELCRRCRLICKQSFRAEIIECPNYYSKRSKKHEVLFES